MKRRITDATVLAMMIIGWVAAGCEVAGGQTGGSPTHWDAGDEGEPPSDSDSDTGEASTDADSDSDSDSGETSADADSDADAEGDADGDPPASDDSDSGEASADADSDADSDSEICDEQGFSIEPRPVSLMILLDRSSSMVTNPDAPPTNWSDAVLAMNTLLGSWSNPYVRFGLDFFPDGSDSTPDWMGVIADCGVSNPVQLDCAQDGGQGVIDFLTATSPPPPSGNMTPMWCALDNFTDPSYAAGCLEGDIQPHVVMISDGTDTCSQSCDCDLSSCSDPNHFATAAELAGVTSDLLAQGVKTFVIGFGGYVDVTKLNAIAAAGGTVLTNYLIANDQAQLLDALDQIAEAVVSCEWEINDPAAEADPDQVNFYFDDEVVPYIGDGGDCSTSVGWAWVDDTHKSVKICGDKCIELKGGTVDTVTARFGCPSRIVV